MQRVAADRQATDLRPPDGAGSLAMRSRPRRSSLTVLASVAVVVLICFLIGVAAGLITDDASAPTPLKTAKIPPALARALAAGWGAQSSYIGRYHVRVLAASGARASRPTGGQLTLFMRVAKTGKPPVPSGILALQAPSGIELVYLTSLISTAGALQATINGGAFVGPVIGSFTGIKTRGSIIGVASVPGLGSFEAQFPRFSHSPQP